jgi:tetratricopeptide (TPR) repeat protein
MVKKIKISKKKLKQPDEFITFTEKGLRLIGKYLKHIAIGAVVVVFILLAFFIFRYWEKGKEAQASQKFNSAVDLYQKANSPYREGTSDEFRNVLGRFDEVIGQFPRTSSGRIALLHKGNIHLRLGEFEEAVKAYETLLTKSGIEKVYHSLALEGLGYAYEGKKEYEKALHAFKETLRKGEKLQSAETYLNMGRIYEEMGKTDEALENYKSYLKVAQKSQKNQFVLRKISLLEN